ncbi:MAG: glycosyltransferase [Planctomycetota bacterium]
MIIPTRADGGAVAACCVAALEPQLRPRDELFVSVDGTAESATLGDAGRARIVEGDRAGPGMARNRALKLASSELVLFLNDDVVAAPDLLDRHRAAHEACGRPSMILGSAPWHRPKDDLIIDRMLRETSMVFFYDRMANVNAGKDWGYRHAWTLNLSIPRAIASEFDPLLTQPMFDDLEWAYRVQLTHAAPVLYRPEARVTHHHRYLPEQLLRREALLGHQTVTLMRCNPSCGHAVFGERFDPDRTNAATHEHALQALRDDAHIAFDRFASLGPQPASTIGDTEFTDLFRDARVWRDYARSFGFVGAVRGTSVEDVQQAVIDEMAVTTRLA